MLPFLWLHGEPQERIKEEILAIKNSGISEFCAESRPYENFCRDEWWEDFGFILKTARALGMRVWLLDDRHYPTGFANGLPRLPENAHLRKRHIREKQTEVTGPMKGAYVCVGGWVERPDEKLLRVVAYRHNGEGEELDYSTAIDLTDKISDGMVRWDIPDGGWRICATVETGDCFPEGARKYGYIDMLNPESCKLMIKAVYQPHYDHFAEYFGNTFAGFFSDEPGFLNGEGTYKNKLGIMGATYPWRSDLPELIAESAGMSVEDAKKYIPALWEDIGEMTSRIRMHYMEVITKLYRENFGNMLGDWCRDHGVMYIGHVIEDNGAHMRMSYGAGHFFRALDGQDMAGIDVVLIQDIPGCADYLHRTPLSEGGLVDPTFFRYTMPKLASSHSHIQPLKQGRAMCEIFGAFGWAGGLPFMKGLADIMLVSGINHFVPHAFTPKEEDPDCPPHFYNGGKNIQYPLFKDLMNYMGRISHILTGATHRADVAVYYNAEGEWTGGENQIFHELCKKLSRNLIDFDIVPYDYLSDADVLDGKLVINGESYGALIISKSNILPIDRLNCFASLADRGLPVIFTDSLPGASSEGQDISSLNSRYKTVSTDELCAYLREKKLCHVDGKGEGLEHLRFYHVTRGEREIYLFSNEDIRHDLSAELILPENGEYLVYEPWDNRIYKGITKNERLELSIEKGNMIFIIFGEEIPEGTPDFVTEIERIGADLSYDIAVKEEGDCEFKLIAEKSSLTDIGLMSGRNRFSGDVRYRTSFEYVEGFDVIDLGEVGETAELWLNGKYVGCRVCAPYKFSLKDAMCDGKNELEVIVKSNPAHKRRDRLSRYMQIPPTGIMGEVAFCKYGK